MKKGDSLRLIYGTHYDLVSRGKRYSTLAADLLDNLHLLGLYDRLHHLVLVMARHRFSLTRAIPGAAALASELGCCRQVVYRMIAVLEEAGLLAVTRAPGQPMQIDLDPLILRLKALLRRKERQPAARLPTYLLKAPAPKAVAPAEAPTPLPTAPGMDNPPPEEEEEEEDIAAAGAAPEPREAAAPEAPDNRYAAFLWQQVAARVQPAVSTAAYQNWIAPLRGRQWEDGMLWVDTGDSTRLLQAESRFLDLVNRALAEMQPGGQVRFYYPKVRRAATASMATAGG